MSPDPQDVAALRQRINELEGRLAERRKYGLVWEEPTGDEDDPYETEHVADRAQRQLPVIVEEPALNVGDGLRPHILIEGDNYFSLLGLSFTHHGKVDVIYIDPPYNTGKDAGDFRYNDRFVGTEDSYRHSKWLSFMAPRLNMAKELLREQGIIIVSIDDNEMAHLRLLMDEIFDEENFVACLPTVMNLKGNQDQLAFAGTHEYTLIYARNKAKARFRLLEVDDEVVLDDWHEDEDGYWKQGANLKATGKNAPREKRPNLWFPVYVSVDGLRVGVERVDESDSELWPISDNKEMSWRWGQKKFQDEPHNLLAIPSKDGSSWSIYKKQRPEVGELPSAKPKSILYRPEYSSSTATNDLKKMFGGERAFQYPKPIALIKDLIKICAGRDAVILDFFAGSATTGHAVLELNAEDGGTRQFILCTNDENGICRQVAHKRLRLAIDGYSYAGGRGKGQTTVVGGLGGSLRFFVSDREFVEYSETTADMKRAFRKASTDLLRLRENCFGDVAEERDFAIFVGAQDTGLGSLLAVLYHQRATGALIAALAARSAEMPIVLYGFSLDGNLDQGPFHSALGERVRFGEVPQQLIDTYERLFSKRLFGGWS